MIDDLLIKVLYWSKVNHLIQYRQVSHQWMRLANHLIKTQHTNHQNPLNRYKVDRRMAKLRHCFKKLQRCIRTESLSTMKECCGDIGSEFKIFKSKLENWCWNFEMLENDLNRLIDGETRIVLTCYNWQPESTTLSRIRLGVNLVEQLEDDQWSLIGYKWNIDQEPWLQEINKFLTNDLSSFLHFDSRAKDVVNQSTPLQVVQTFTDCDIKMRVVKYDCYLWFRSRDIDQMPQNGSKFLAVGNNDTECFWYTVSDDHLCRINDDSSMIQLFQRGQWRTEWPNSRAIVRMEQPLDDESKVIVV